MIFANCTELTEITRTGKPGVHKFVVDEGLENGSEAEFYIANDGSLHVGVPGTAPEAERGYEPKRAQGIATLNPGTTNAVFNYGEDDASGEPLIWILTQSIMVSNNIANDMSVIMLDGYMLVCLRKGIIEVQKNDEGETLQLARGLKRIREDLTFASASSEEFLGLPKDDLRIMNSVFAFEILRKRSKHGFDFSCKINAEGSGLLDSGVYFDQDEVEEAEIRAKAEAEELLREKREAAEARAREEAKKSVEEDLGKTAKSFGTRRKNLKIETDTDGRSLAAQSFLSGLGV